MKDLDLRYHNIPLENPSGPFQDCLKGFSGIKPLVVGAFNETNDEFLQIIHHATEAAATRMVSSGLAKDKTSALKACSKEYKQRVGCALTKANALHKTRALGFAAMSKSEARDRHMDASTSSSSNPFGISADTDADYFLVKRHQSSSSAFFNRHND